jgi:hypothetical protein
VANRAARLAKEEGHLRARALERDALRRAKKRREEQQTTQLVRMLAGQARNRPQALRRRSVRLGMFEHPMLLLTVALYCDRPNKLCALENWSPPRSCRQGTMFDSFQKRVLTLAPLRDLQHKRLVQLIQTPSPDDASSWLLQTATDPDVVCQLPMTPVRLFADMNLKLYNDSPKHSLSVSLRRAQVLLFGAPVSLADTIAWMLPAAPSGMEAYFLRGIRFLIKHHAWFNALQIRHLLLFMKEPSHIIQGPMRQVVEKRLGRCMLDFGADDPALVWEQMTQWDQLLYKVNLEIRFFPFPRTPLRDAYRGSGDFEGYAMHRLLHPAALEREGWRMDHCVASYTERCYEEVCSIWSMTYRGRNVATIELKAHRQIVQFKGKNNSKVSGEPRLFLLHWAKEQKLEYVDW